MYIFISLLSIPFLYLNYKIIRSDIKYKKIPNKYLGYLLLLLPLFYIYIFSTYDINILSFTLKYVLSIFISFLLYYYGVWSAGDAKYLLVLSFFIPPSGIITFVSNTNDIVVSRGIIPFIGNIALLTILYLLIYFIYFYIVKIGFDKAFRKSLYRDIITQNKEKIDLFFTNGQKGKIERKEILKKILKLIIIFFTIFVILRLTRIYLFEYIQDYYKNGEDSGIKEYLKENIGYIFGGSILIVILLYIIMRRLAFFIIRYGFQYIAKKVLKRELSKNDIKNSFLFILIIGLLSFIFYEYLNSGKIIFEKLYLIFTFYLIIYFLVRMLIFSYKLTFQIAEQDYIFIKNLKEGDLIDKMYLVNIFGTQKCLGYGINKEGILHPNPENYFLNISVPVLKEDVDKIKQIYKIVEEYHIKMKTQNYEPKKDIKILKTFSFGIYILVGFIMTYLMGDKIYDILIDILTKFFERFYSF